MGYTPPRRLFSRTLERMKGVEHMNAEDRLERLMNRRDQEKQDATDKLLKAAIQRERQRLAACVRAAHCNVDYPGHGPKMYRHGYEDAKKDILSLFDLNASLDAALEAKGINPPNPESNPPALSVTQAARIDGAIEECVHTLVARWESFSANAMQAGCVEQSEEAYQWEMVEQVRPILQALITVANRHLPKAPAPDERQKEETIREVKKAVDEYRRTLLAYLKRHINAFRKRGLNRDFVALATLEIAAKDIEDNCIADPRG